MKILIVDDELVSRKKMQKIVESLGESQAVDNGKDAMDSFVTAWEAWVPFDLILLDISMPEIGGVDVLNWIRSKEENILPFRRVKIIVVSANKDKNAIMECIRAGCDDYIVKPFGVQIVHDKIEKLGFCIKTPGAPESDPKHGGTAAEIKAAIETGEEMIQAVLERLKKGTAVLPPYPEIGMKFKHLLGQNAGVKEVSELLKWDPAISAKLLSVSNSPYYRGRVPHKTLEEAVKRLGLKTTGHYVDMLCTQSLFAKSSRRFDNFMKKLWEHSLACGLAAQLLSERIGMKMTEDPFCLGLLHDIGKLWLLEIFDEMSQRGRLADSFSDEMLLNVMDTLHNDLGMAVFERWGYATEYLLVAQYHDNISKAETITKPLLIVHLCNALVQSMGYELSGRHNADEILFSTASLLKLAEKDLNELAERTKELLEIALQAILPEQVVVELKPKDEIGYGRNRNSRPESGSAA